MNNIKGFAVASDGEMKRIAVTYDTLDESGEVTAQNQKLNRVVMDRDVIEAITTITEYAQGIVDGAKQG